MAILTTVPTSGKGKVNDVLGMVAVDSTHFYYTTGNYTGSTVIWYKVAKNTNTPVPVPTPITPPPPIVTPGKLPSIFIKTTTGSKTVKVEWSTSDATSMTLDGVNVPLKSQLPVTYNRDREKGKTITFIAIGPGGSTTRRVLIPGDPGGK
jgi:hypothetical protein